MNSKGPRVCLDKILPWELRNPRPLASLPPLTAGGRERAIMPIAKRWPAGTKLGVRFMGGSDSQHQMIVSTVAEWMKHCGIVFSFNEAPDAEVRISFENDGAWSYVGTDVADIPLHAATMNFGWLDEGTILHEFGHTLGLGHEHQNPAGGIQWNEAKVIADLAGPPNFWNEAKVRHNVLRKYQLDHINGTTFDPDSIMLYAFPGDWTLSGLGTRENSALSQTDKAFIGSMYPKTGDPGEEDLFSFRVPSTG
ncbi:MAG: peptidase, partial [Akkermansiaceae bacterium]|nr:peptidase [Akkermansiaceae bacterium]